MEERKKVLELVKDGHLTVEEGDRLLGALEGAQRPREEPSQLEDVIADCVSGRVRGVRRAFRIDPAEFFEVRAPRRERVVEVHVQKEQ